MTHPLKCSYPEGYEKKCLNALETALKKVPAYHSWKSADIGGKNVFSRYKALPLLDKALMNKYGPTGFVPEGLDLKKALATGKVEIVKTSGSTGDRVSNVWYQPWWDASERSSWKLNSTAAQVCTGTHREAILASPLCVGFHRKDKYLSREERSLGRFLFLNERVNPAHWTDRHMSRMLSELNEYRPVLLEANPSYLARLSRFINRNKLEVYKPPLIVFTYENPSILHQRQIDKAFGVPMASSYGSTETAYVFMQCECGKFHQNTEHCHVDFIPFSRKHRGPLTGAILVTTLANPWQSLLRFDIGDIVTLSTETCPCGRNDGLTLDTIEGRAVNITTSSNGRAVTQAALDRAIADIEGIAEYQLIQTAPYNYSFYYVPEENHIQKKLRVSLRKPLVASYGKKARFELLEVKGISPDPPGKYRLAKPLININPRNFLETSYQPFPFTEKSKHPHYEFLS